MRVQVFGEGGHADAAFLDEDQEPLEPAVLVDPFAGPRPDAELLAVVTEDGRAAGLADRAEVAVEVGEGTERNEIAERLIDGENAQRAALVLRDVARMEVPDPGVAKVLLVEQRVLDARLGQRSRQVGLPDPLGQPYAARPAAEVPGQEVAHHPDLADPVGLGDERQDGFVESAAEELDLIAADHPRDEVPAGPLALFHVFPERAGEVEGELERGVADQAFEEGTVAVVERRLEHVVEIADRLVVVDREQEFGTAHGAETPSWARM